MFKLRIIAVLIGLSAFLIINGGTQLYVAAMNRHPTVITLKQFEATRPTAGWYQVTQCVPDWGEIVPEHSASDPSNTLYLPLLQPDVEKGAQSEVLLETDDPIIFKTFSELGATGDDSKAEAYVESHADTFLGTQTFTGMIRFGDDSLDEDIRQKISSQADEMGDGFAVLREGAKPDPLSGLLKFGAGIALAGFLLYRLAKYLQNRPGGKGTGAKSPAASTSGPWAETSA